MSDMKKKFEKAAEDAKQLPSRPSDDVMLELYALYKQSTAGDVAGDRPGMFDLVGKAKYDAWSKQKGLTKDTAMKKYVDLVESLKKQK
jgi:diazepam-binding inhibitor (GABA receptor modulator, acyl-CoA-binding protein)